MLVAAYAARALVMQLLHHLVSASCVYRLPCRHPLLLLHYCCCCCRRLVSAGAAHHLAARPAAAQSFLSIVTPSSPPLPCVVASHQRQMRPLAVVVPWMCHAAQTAKVAPVGCGMVTLSDALHTRARNATHLFKERRILVPHHDKVSHRGTAMFDGVCEQWSTKDE